MNHKMSAKKFCQRCGAIMPAIAKTCHNCKGSSASPCSLSADDLERMGLGEWMKGSPEGVRHGLKIFAARINTHLKASAGDDSARRD